MVRRKMIAAMASIAAAGNNMIKLLLTISLSIIKS